MPYHVEQIPLQQQTFVLPYLPCVQMKASSSTSSHSMQTTCGAINLLVYQIPCRVSHVTTKGCFILLIILLFHVLTTFMSTYSMRHMTPQAILEPTNLMCYYEARTIGQTWGVTSLTHTSLRALSACETSQRPLRQQDLCILYLYQMYVATWSP
jgi:hypothetical protein